MDLIEIRETIKNLVFEWRDTSAKVSTYDLIGFYMVLRTMIEAKTSVLDAIKTMSPEIENRQLRKLVGELDEDGNVTDDRTIIYRLQGGESLASCLESYPAIFSKLHVVMIRAGEESNTLGAMLRAIEDSVERFNNLKRNLKEALTEPVVLSVMLIINSFIIFFYTLPQILKVLSSYKNESLSMLTRVVMTIGVWINNEFFIASLLIVVIAACFTVYYFYKQGEIDRYIQFLPFIGRAYNLYLCAGFANILSITTGKGALSLKESLHYVPEITENQKISEEIQNVTLRVLEGASLSDQLLTTSFFPKKHIQKVRTGEMTNTLAEMFQIIFNNCIDEIKRYQDKVMRTVKPVLIFVIIFIFLILTYVMFTPYFIMLEGGGLQ